MTVCVSLSLRGRINGGGEPLAVRAPLMNGRKSLACGVITGSAMHGAAMYDATLRPAIDHQCCIRRGRRLLLASLHKLSYSLVMRQAAAGPRCIPKTCMNANITKACFLSDEADYGCVQDSVDSAASSYAG